MDLLILLALASLGGLCSTALAGGLLASGRHLQRIVPHLVCYAAGVLLAGATLGLLPRALASAPPEPVLGVLLAGFGAFFVLESLVLSRHGHGQEVGVSTQTTGTLILLSDAVHNFLDGVAIGVAYLTGLPVGIATALAVAAHEVPQEVGDLGILISGGMGRRRAFLLNMLSAVPTVPGALAGYLFFTEIQQLLWVHLSLAASSFLYIALADLVPLVQRGGAWRTLLQRFGLISAGIATVVFIQALN